MILGIRRGGCLMMMPDYKGGEGGSTIWEKVII